MPPPEAASKANEGASGWRPSPIPPPPALTGEEPPPPAKRGAAEAADLRGPTSKKFGGALPFFQVDTPKPAEPEKEISVDEDRGPDSGLIDIRGMASLEEKAKREDRAGADLFNLSGGLFGPTPLAPLNAPDVSAIGAAESRGDRSTTGRRVAPVLPASAAPLASGGGQTAEEPNPFAKRRGNGVRIALGVVGVVGVVVLALKLGQSFGGRGSEAEVTGEVSTATSVSTVAPREGESRPSPTPGAVAAAPTVKAVDPGAPATAAATAVATAAATAAAVATGTPAAATGAGATAGAAAGVGASPAKPASTGGAQAGAGAVAATPAPPPAAPAAPAPAAGASFDVAAAKAAMVPAVLKASACRKPEDPTGGAKVSITFAPSGRVTSARVTGPPFAGTSTGGCIAAAFRGVSIPPFSGDPVSVTKEVSVR